MRSPEAFLRFFVRAALNQVGFGVAGELVVEVLPALPRDLWAWWGKDQPEAELRAEVQQLAQLPDNVMQKQAPRLVAEEGASKPEVVRQQVTILTGLVPQAIRASQRRLADPSGRTVAPGLRLREPDDLLVLLPSRLPRFRPGQHPLPGIERELVELLGVGGFGEVWRARNPYLGDEMALKFCLDPKAAQTLRNEVALLRRLRGEGAHPGIVRLRDAYLNADPPCLEYDYVEGGDLAGLLRESQDKMSIELCRDTMLSLADIVGFAHSKGIIHRDLKPANILVQNDGKGSFTLRVADFGIGGVVAAQMVDRSRTGTNRAELLTTSLRGAYTPLYASPEQMLGKPADTRDDVYALGVIWYQLVVGDLGLVGLPSDWREEVMAKGMPAQQVDLLGRCLAGKAERRLPDARTLAAGLAQKELNARAEQDRTVPRSAPAPSTMPPLPTKDVGSFTPPSQPPVQAPLTRPLFPPEPPDTKYLWWGGFAGLAPFYALGYFGVPFPLSLGITAVVAFLGASIGAGISWREAIGKAGNSRWEDLKPVVRAWRRIGWGLFILSWLLATSVPPFCTGCLYSNARKVLDQAADHREKARQHRKASEYNKAISEYNEALQVMGSLRQLKEAAEFYRERAETHLLNLDMAKALGDFDEAIRLDPTNASLYECRATCLLLKNDHDRAFADANEALRLDPKRAWSYFRRGQIYWRRGDKERAMEDRATAIKLNPKLVQAEWP